MVSLDKVCSVAVAWVWLGAAAYYDEFDISGEGLRMGPFGKSFPLVEADEQK